MDPEAPMRTPVLLLVAVLAAFGSGACGSSDAEEPDIAAEYIVSNEVRNDPLATESCCEDRMAELAVFGTPVEVIRLVLGPVRCDGRCELNDAERDAVREFPGGGATLYTRGMLVKHEDGVLEYARLLLVRHDGNAGIIDANGGTYEDLEDFRANNDLYGSEDRLLVSEDVTAVAGQYRVVTVSGHTTPAYVWWLVGAGAALLIALVAFIVVRAVLRGRFRKRRIGLADSS
jgi:hypothetical protein